MKITSITPRTIDRIRDDINKAIASTLNDLGIEGWIQGTGYTGEAGYEIFVPNSQAALLWRKLIQAGSVPIGLGARDTLRLEKGFLLSGVDFCWPPLSEVEESAFLARDSWETNVPFGLDLEHDFIGFQFDKDFVFVDSFARLTSPV